MTTSHLTDEQFSDFLADDSASQEAIAHLDACEHCRAELAELHSAMGSFNEISLAWAEVEAPRRIQSPTSWQIRRRTLPAWGLAVATMMAVAAIGIHRELDLRSPAVPTVSTAEVTAPSSGELAQDNRLLMSIDQELSYQVQPAVPVNHRAHGTSRYPARQVAN
ncbi:MAG TPA: hypothetical protein VGN16_22120 [Acidobacteriaceae bacterium]|jgi:anti-sigma factor RsiW